MNESTHVMLRLLREDAGLDAPIEAQYDNTPKPRWLGKFSVRLLATCIAMVAFTGLALAK